MKLPDFLEELNQASEKALGNNAQSMIDSPLCAKMTPKLKRSVNMALFENGSYDKIVAHLNRELKLNALEKWDNLLNRQRLTQHLSPKTFSPMCFLPILPEIFERKRIKWSKTARNTKKGEGCKKGQTNSEENLP